MRMMILLLTVLLTARNGIAGEAADCPLRGTVRTETGLPAPDTPVVILRGALIKRITRQLTTDGAGMFVITDLPCGKYQVVADGRPINIDTNTQAEVTMIVDDNLVAARRTLKELSDARTSRASRPMTADEQRDEEVADAFRREVIERLGSADEAKAYVNAAASQKLTLFGQVLVKRMSALGVFEDSAAGDQKNQHLDNKLKLTASFVERQSIALGPSFLGASQKERVRLALIASLASMEKQPWPSIPLLLYTDAADGVGARAMVQRILGDASDEASLWDNNFSPKWRSEAVLKAMIVATEAAIAVTEGQLRIDTFTARLGLPSSGDAERVLRAVNEAFGSEGVERYRKGSDAVQVQIFTDAVLTNFAFGWIVVSSI